MNTKRELAIVGEWERKTELVESENEQKSILEATKRDIVPSRWTDKDRHWLR